MARAMKRPTTAGLPGSKMKCGCCTGSSSRRRRSIRPIRSRILVSSLRRTLVEGGAVLAVSMRTSISWRSLPMISLNGFWARLLDVMSPLCAWSHSLIPITKGCFMVTRGQHSHADLARSEKNEGRVEAARLWRLWVAMMSIGDAARYPAGPGTFQGSLDSLCYHLSG